MGATSRGEKASVEGDLAVRTRSPADTDDEAAATSRDEEPDTKVSRPARRRAGGGTGRRRKESDKRIGVARARGECRMRGPGRRAGKGGGLGRAETRRDETREMKRCLSARCEWGWECAVRGRWLVDGGENLVRVGIPAGRPTMVGPAELVVPPAEVPTTTVVHVLLHMEEETHDYQRISRAGPAAFSM
jgi:hypothetical protein